MATDESVTQYLHRLKSSADPAAAQSVWDCYFTALVAVARRRLVPGRRRSADEEDVALGAFDSFFRGVAEGRFSKLENRDDLWQVLVLLAERKAIDQIRRETAGKRGNGAVRGDSAFQSPTADGRGSPGADILAGAAPPPELVASFAEECERLLAKLDVPELRQIALLKLEGHTNDEIATAFNRPTRFVERKLQAIRTIWDGEGGEG